MTAADLVFVGCNPSFDLERLTRLLQRHGMEPGWHYRPICVTTLTAGALTVDNYYRLLLGTAEHDSDILTLPWSSDAISTAIGINPADYPRHTAMGDVEWARAQFDAVTGSGGSDA